MERTVFSPSLYSTWLLSGLGRMMSHLNKICLSGLWSRDPPSSHSLEKMPFCCLQEIALASLVSSPPDKSILWVVHSPSAEGKKLKQPARERGDSANGERAPPPGRGHEVANCWGGGVCYPEPKVAFLQNPTFH